MPGRVAALEIRDYKGIAFVFEPPAATVFFGPNGSGKSNILEAIAEVLGWAGDFRRDPLEEYPDLELHNTWALLHADDALLEYFLRSARVPEDSSGEARFYLADSVGIRPIDLSGTLAEMLRYIREDGIMVAQGLSDPGPWEEMGDSYGIVLDAWLGSRSFLLYPGSITWMHPRADDCIEQVREAGRRVWERRESWPDRRIILVHEFVRHLVGEAGYPETGGDDFDVQWTRHGPDLGHHADAFVDIVHMDASGPALASLVDRVAMTIRDAIKEGLGS